MYSCGKTETISETGVGMFVILYCEKDSDSLTDLYI